MCFDEDGVVVRELVEEETLFALKQKITLGPRTRCGVLGLGHTMLEWDTTTAAD